MPRSLAAWFLVAVTLLSGCLSVADPPASLGEASPALPRVRLDPPGAVEYATPKILGDVLLGAEPSIETAADGWTYVTTPLALWRSSDGGSTYEHVGAPFCPLDVPACPGLEERDPGMQGGGDADVVATPDGALHWLGLAAGNNAIPYQSSTDRGDTWTNVVDLAGDDDADREWLAARADGTLFAAWRNFPTTGEAFIVTRTSYDGGTSWTPASKVAKDTRQGGVAVDPSSDLLVLPYDVDGAIHVARSWDNGTTWTSSEVSAAGPRGHIFPVAAVDEAGAVYVVWAQDMRGDVAATMNRGLEVPSVYLSVSHDGAQNWSPPMRISKPGASAVFPWIAAGAEGRIVIVWYENALGTPLRAPGTWRVMSAVSYDGDFPDARFTRSTVTPEPMHVGSICSDGGACLTSGGDRSMLDFFQVAIHPDGHAVVAWAQDADARLARARVAASRVTSAMDLLGEL